MDPTAMGSFLYLYLIFFFFFSFFLQMSLRVFPCVHVLISSTLILVSN